MSYACWDRERALRCLCSFLQSSGNALHRPNSRSWNTTNRNIRTSSLQESLNGLLKKAKYWKRKWERIGTCTTFRPRRRTHAGLSRGRFCFRRWPDKCRCRASSSTPSPSSSPEIATKDAITINELALTITHFFPFENLQQYGQYGTIFFFHIANSMFCYEFIHTDSTAVRAWTWKNLRKYRNAMITRWKESSSVIS